MATTNTFTSVPSSQGYSWVATWGSLLQTEVGLPIENTGSPDRSVTVSGTFGVGGTVTIEGSNDGTNYFTLNDPQGNPLSFTSGRIEQILEVARYMRPKVTSGDGTTNISVSMLLTGLVKG